MTRARISKAGPRIALFGYDVDTAPPDKMAFDPSYVAFRLALTGTVAVSTEMGPFYRMATVTYDEPFSKAPHVRVAGALQDSRSDQTVFYWGDTSVIQGLHFRLPYYIITSQPEGFSLLVLRRVPRSPTDYNNYHNTDAPLNWRWWAFHNTLVT